MYYVRTSGGGMMPVNFKASLLRADKKETVKTKSKSSKNTKKRSLFGSK